jgi:hypothetical protein
MNDWSVDEMNKKDFSDDSLERKTDFSQKEKGFEKQNRAIPTLLDSDQAEFCINDKKKIAEDVYECFELFNKLIYRFKKD